MTEWRPDVLGDEFECTDLDLGEDEEGPLVATLVRALPAPRGFWDRLLRRERELEHCDVVYVHGWSDYFFQKPLARFFTARGARFFAIDLRKYGRSLREGQTPGYIDDLAQYDREIDAALAIVRGGAAVEHGVGGVAADDPVLGDGGGTGGGNGEGAAGEGGSASESARGGANEIGEDAAGQRPAGAAVAGDHREGGAETQPAGSGGSRRLILLGHSTGGLVLSLWADRHRGEADALVLNSPWLELQLSGAARRALATVVNVRARLSPHELALPQIDMGFYSQAQRACNTPEELAQVNTVWRPEHTLPVRAAWLRAILAGHARISSGIDVGAPVCVLLSARSYFGLSWNDAMSSADTVLEVEGVARAALRLGGSVTVERIDGALHDVFLSRQGVRQQAFARMRSWLLGWQAASDAPPPGPGSEHPV